MTITSGHVVELNALKERVADLEEVLVDQGLEMRDLKESARQARREGEVEMRGKVLEIIGGTLVRDNSLQKLVHVIEEL